MTLQERDQLIQFLNQLSSIQVADKDLEADLLIRNLSAKQPDAVYLLVQRAMGLEVAMQAAQTQINALKNQINQQQATNSQSFLNSANTWGKQAVSPNSVSPTRMQTSAPQANAATITAPAAANSAWGSGMLGSIATTAAGVVAGSLLYQGISNLMHHPNTNDSASTPHPQATNAMEMQSDQIDSPTEFSDLSSDFGVSDFDTSDSA